MLFSKFAFQSIPLLGILILLFNCKIQPELKEKEKSPFIGKIVEQLPENIWVIYQDQDANYWFGGNGDGVFLYDGTTLKQFTEDDGLASNQIRGIQEDELGNIYFDTPDGVSKFNGLSFVKLNPIVSAENEWRSRPNDLWFKGNGDIDGVYRYDGESLFYLKLPKHGMNAFGLKEEDSLYSPFGVYGVYNDENGNLWVGTLAAGVYLYKKDAQLWISEKELLSLEDGRVPGVRSIIEDKDGNFWLSNILNRYRIYEDKSTIPATIKYEKLKGIEFQDGQEEMDFSYFISAVKDDENQDLWLVTYSEGVWRYDGTTLSNYTIKNGATYALLTSIYKDKQGVLWLGTQNAGVFKFNGEKFVQFDP